MFKAIAFLAAVALLAASAMAQGAPKMGAGFIGPVTSEMSEQELIALGLAYERTESGSEAGPVVVYEIHPDPRNVVTVVFGEDGKQQLIWTEAQGYATAEGARVGDTVAQLKKLYPTGAISKSVAEGLNLYFLPFGLEVTEGPHAFFRLNADGLTEACVFDDKGCPDYADRRSESFQTLR